MLLKHHFSPDTLSLLSHQPRAPFAKKKKKKEKEERKKKVFPPFCFSVVIKQLAHKMEVLRSSSCILLLVGFTCMQAAGTALCCRACEIGP